MTAQPEVIRHLDRIGLQEQDYRNLPALPFGSGPLVAGVNCGACESTDAPNEPPVRRTIATELSHAMWASTASRLPTLLHMRSRLSARL